MKEVIKKIIPVWLLKWHRNHNSKFRNMNAKEVFTEIYKSNHWKSSKSISGPGSEIAQTNSLIANLDKLLYDNKITSVLDIPCGDFKWMQKVDLSKIDYIGADIVDELIHTNIKLYIEKYNVNFCILNLISDPLPKSDLIIVRDCLVHFSFADIYSAIKNIKESGCKYLLATTFTNYHSNYDIQTGDWRRLNLLENPFSFPKPIIVINENCSEVNGEYNDKSLALWEISKI